MKRHKFFIILSLLLIPVIIGTYCFDILGGFNFADKAFGIALAIYIIFIFIQQSSSKFTFVISLFFLVIMGLFYIPSGVVQRTERMGEWFYVFFVFGLIQSVIELWFEKFLHFHSQL